MYLKFTGEDGYLFNINWFRFVSGDVRTRDKITGPAKDKISMFKTVISKNKLSIIPEVNNIRFSVSLFEFDGRLVTRKKHLTGAVSVPVTSRGIYIVDINWNRNVEKKLISVLR